MEAAPQPPVPCPDPARRRAEAERLLEAVHQRLYALWATSFKARQFKKDTQKLGLLVHRWA